MTEQQRETKKDSLFKKIGERTLDAALIGVAIACLGSAASGFARLYQDFKHSQIANHYTTSHERKKEIHEIRTQPDNLQFIPFYRIIHNPYKKEDC